MAKKILIFSLVYYPRFIGGAEVAVKEITDRIKPEDIEFHLIALRLDRSLPKTERIGNVTVHRVGYSSYRKVSPDSLPYFLHPNKYLFPFLAFFKARSLNHEHRFDAIWSIMANYAGFGALFFKLFHMGVPMILTLQEGDPIDYIKRRVRLVYPLFRMIFTYADEIQAISKYLADFARDMGAKREPAVVPNGVDVAHFSAAIPEAELSALKARLGKGPDDIFIITTSRLVVKNAVADIVSSLQYLPLNVKLLILGTGYEERSLRSQAEKLGLSLRVSFLGYVSHDDMPRYLKASDVFVRPSLSEGFGNSFIEAMAAGIPVVATPVGGIVDFLRNKETGLFCDVGDPKDIARKVEVFLRDRALRDEIVDNALHMVVDHYDWNTVAKYMKSTVFDKAVPAS
ncbi:MAG: glycosyltransferase family 4 protein [Candidatus Paceibacterota bacterium]